MPPVHLKIFVRDLGSNIYYSADGDLSQGLFEDFILHEDEKQPVMKKGHYNRTVKQIEQCVRYIDFCMTQQPGCFERQEPLFPLTADSSRLIYTLVKVVGSEDNRAPTMQMLAAFLGSAAEQS